MFRFSPASEFKFPNPRAVSRADAPAAAHEPAALVAYPRAAVGNEFQRSMQRLISASKRCLVAARSSLESCKLSDTLLDILTLISCALFVALTAAAIVGGFFILIFCSL